MDPMEEKRRNALRRKVADTLHALARKIENGDIEVESINKDQDLQPDPLNHPHAPVEHIPTGREILTIHYFVKPRRK
jgi:hypothetical protein